MKSCETSLNDSKYGGNHKLKNRTELYFVFGLFKTQPSLSNVDNKEQSGTNIPDLHTIDTLNHETENTSLKPYHL